MQIRLFLIISSQRLVSNTIFKTQFGESNEDNSFYISAYI
jgi:hypothetical protein